MGDQVQFYPSHLTKGLIGATVSFLAGRYAFREFKQIGTDVYPEVPEIPQNAEIEEKSA